MAALAQRKIRNKF